MISADDRTAKSEPKSSPMKFDVLVNGISLPFFTSSRPFDGAHSRSLILPPPLSSYFSLRITNSLSRRLCFRVQVSECDTEKRNHLECQ